jgi:hypothetical protein
MWTLLGFGVFLTLLWGSQTFRPTTVPDGTRKFAFVLLVFLSLDGMVWGALRSVVMADAAGVVARNPFSQKRRSR